MTKRPIVGWLWMLVMMIAVQTVGVSQARASCGDYLIHGGSLPHGLVLPNLEGHEPHSLPMPQLPCRGPGCQKAPADPIQPGPARVVPPEIERLGCLSDSPPLPTMVRTRLDEEFVEKPMTGNLRTVEHPPRAMR